MVCYAVPFDELAEKQIGRPPGSDNMLYVGVLIELLGLDFEVTGGSSPTSSRQTKAIEPNLAAIQVA